MITCNTDTFYGVGVNPVIAVFTAHEPHDPAKLCKFIDFRDDGYEVRAHIGLVEGNSAKDKRQHLLDVWRGKVEAPSKFCVTSTVTAEDEWLHSVYYFNDEIPSDADFEKAIGDYLTFEFSMVMQNREYLFANLQHVSELGAPLAIPKLTEKEWRPIRLSDIGIISSGRDIYELERIPGNIPYITSGSQNNGIGYFVGNKNSTIDADYIAFNRNGAVGKAFYHPYESLMGNDCRKLHLKNHNDGLYTGLFIATVISMQSVCFSYSRKLGTERAKKLRIMLPMNGSGAPDYAYMEQYVKNLLRKKYRQYLDFLEAQRKVDTIR